MKTRNVIGFKADAETLNQFERLVEALDLEENKSMLAERAHKKGVMLAAEEIKKEKVQRAQTTASKLSALSLQALHVLRLKRGCVSSLSCYT